MNVDGLSGAGVLPDAERVRDTEKVWRYVVGSLSPPELESGRERSQIHQDGTQAR